MKFIIRESQLLRSKEKYLDKIFKGALLLNNRFFSRDAIIFVTPEYDFLFQYQKELSLVLYNEEISSAYINIFYPNDEQEFQRDLKDWLSINYEIRPKHILSASPKFWENLKKKI
jgi:hypothetical protein